MRGAQDHLPRGSEGHLVQFLGPGGRLFQSLHPLREWLHQQIAHGAAGAIRASGRPYIDSVVHCVASTSIDQCHDQLRPCEWVAIVLGVTLLVANWIPKTQGLKELPLACAGLAWKQRLSLLTCRRSGGKQLDPMLKLGLLPCLPLPTEKKY